MIRRTCGERRLLLHHWNYNVHAEAFRDLERLLNNIVGDAGRNVEGEVHLLRGLGRGQHSVALSPVRGGTRRVALALHCRWAPHVVATSFAPRRPLYRSDCSARSPPHSGCFTPHALSDGALGGGARTTYSRIVRTSWWAATAMATSRSGGKFASVSHIGMRKGLDDRGQPDRP